MMIFQIYHNANVRFFKTSNFILTNNFSFYYNLILFNKIHMSLILEGKSLKSLSQSVIKNPQQIIHLDVSNNELSSGSEFSKFKSLKTLIIDNNAFETLKDFPFIDTLITFSANKNKFKNIAEFCTDLPVKFPNLRHISLLKNDLCPYFIGDEDEYSKYRKCLLISLPGLQNIDGENVEKVVLNKQDSRKNIEEGKFEEGEENAIKGTIEYNEKYKYKSSSKNIKTKSEGNRFLKNEQL